MKIKPYSLLIICVLMIVVILNWSWTYFQPDPIRYTKPVDSPITMCSSWSFNWTDTTLMGTKILPGLGDLRYPVTTTSTKAQEFFEQGLMLLGDTTSVLVTCHKSRSHYLWISHYFTLIYRFYSG